MMSDELRICFCGEKQENSGRSNAHGYRPVTDSSGRSVRSEGSRRDDQAHPENALDRQRSRSQDARAPAQAPIFGRRAKRIGRTELHRLADATGPMSLQGKTAVVTGSTSGIGLGIARALAQEGADIVLNGFGPRAEIAELQAAFENAYGCRVL